MSGRRQRGREFTSVRWLPCVRVRGIRRRRPSHLARPRPCSGRGGGIGTQRNLELKRGGHVGDRLLLLLDKRRLVLVQLLGEEEREKRGRE